MLFRSSSCFTGLESSRDGPEMEMFCPEPAKLHVPWCPEEASHVPEARCAWFCPGAAVFCRFRATQPHLPRDVVPGPSSWCDGRALGHSLLLAPEALQKSWCQEKKTPEAVPPRCKSSPEVLPEGTARLSPTYPIPRSEGTFWEGAGARACIFASLQPSLPNCRGNNLPVCQHRLPAAPVEPYSPRPCRAGAGKGSKATTLRPGYLFCAGVRDFFLYIYFFFCFRHAMSVLLSHDSKTCEQ